MYQDTKDGSCMPRIVIPRIVKADIRKCYPNMYANVYNACDFHLLCGYHRKFYRPDYFCVTETEKLAHGTGAISTLRYEIHGVDAATQVWYEVMEHCPDVVMRLKEAHITVDNDSSGTISVKFTLSCTQIQPEAFETSPARCRVDHDGRDVVVFGEETMDVEKSIETFTSPSFVPIAHAPLDDASQWAGSSATRLQGYVCLEPSTTAVVPTDSPEFTAKQPQKAVEQAMVPVVEHFNGEMTIHFDADSLIYFLEFRLFYA